VQLIVDRISDGKRLPEAVLDEIAVRSDGVPLFVEEMTKAVLESGALLETADAYHLGGPLSGLAIPASLHDSLMARLDRLHPVREVAQAAAVIGRSFDHATIAALMELPEPALGDAMLRLVEAELVPAWHAADASTVQARLGTRRLRKPAQAKRAAMHACLVDVLNGPATPAGGQGATRRGRRATERALGTGRMARGFGAARLPRLPSWRTPSACAG
jgi:hypothetical protein